jgi:hypothetical protein
MKLLGFTAADKINPGYDWWLFGTNESSSHNMIKTLEDWCNANCRGEWKILEPTGSSYSGILWLRLYLGQDAMLMKLTWG